MQIKTGTTLGVLLLMAGTWRSSATELSAVPPAASQTEAVNVDVVHPARVRSRPEKNIYPWDEVSDGREGWVVLGMMIAADGAPYEVTVLDSSGNPAFEKAALKAVPLFTFEPARRGSTPIDSSLQFKLKFAIKNLEKGASPAFVKAYKQFSKAVEARDKASADAQLARMKPQNLYEEAFMNFGKYFYDLAWGTVAEQWKDLERAIAGERQPTYLPKEAFVSALFEKFRIEVQMQDFGKALETWKVLEPLASPEMLKNGQGAIDQIQSLAGRSDQPFGIDGELNVRGNWRTHLLRNQFSIQLKSGSIQEIKFRCAQKYVAFKFQPGIQYSIGPGINRCGLEVVGEPGARFELIQ